MKKMLLGLIILLCVIILQLFGIDAGVCIGIGLFAFGIALWGFSEKN